MALKQRILIENLNTSFLYSNIGVTSKEDISYLLKKEFDYQDGDNCILLTIKYKMDTFKDSFYKSFEINQTIDTLATESLIDISGALGENQGFKDFCISQLWYKRIWEPGWIDWEEHTEYKDFVWHFWAVINIKKHTIDELKQRLTKTDLADCGFTLLYEKATGTSNGYTKPFNRKIYVEAVQNLDETIYDLLKHKDYVGYREKGKYPCIGINVLNNKVNDTRRNIRYHEVNPRKLEQFYNLNHERMDDYIASIYNEEMRYDEDGFETF